MQACRKDTPDALRLAALDEDADGFWTPLAASSALKRPGLLARFMCRRPEPVVADIAGRRYRKCGNYAQHNVCNWMVPEESGEELCIACRPNRTVPNLARRGNPEKWYRTLVGHFRHEIGHYYWDILIRDGGRLPTFRALFGDEQADYGEALEEHYHKGPTTDWQDRFISAYASCHPWEDWAETWAH